MRPSSARCCLRSGLPAASYPKPTKSIAELRKEVEANAESDPDLAMRLMCEALPRVEKEYGENSLELAWWLGSLAMPLIAYKDKHAEAEPLLASAERIYTQKLGPDAEELADIYVAHAWIQFRQGRLAECAGAWKRALAIRELKPGPKSIELQKALVGLAQVQVSLREFAVARATLERAKDILKRNGDEISEAAAAIENTLANVGLREENYADARRHAEAQIEIETRMNSTASQLVPAYVLLGQVLERLDEFEASEIAVREAVRLSESSEGPLQRHRLAALVRLASLLHDRGRPLEARDAARLALTEAERTLGPEAPRLAGVLRIVAETGRSVGDLPDALHAYERAARIIDLHPGDIERHTLVAFYRGTKADLPKLLDANIDSCLLDEGVDTSSYTPVENPPPGQFFWYLAVGVNGSTVGSAGDATSGVRVLNSSGDCP